MNPISFLYTEVLFRPLLNLLVGITNILPGHEVGWAILLVTIIVRTALLPLSIHQARRSSNHQEKMSELQGDVKKIQKKHKDDKAKQAEETMRLYREKGVNPASGCLPLLIQLPILIALYRVFLSGLTPDVFPALYSFVSEPTTLVSGFFGVQLTEPSLQLGVLAGIGQFIQMRYLSPKPPSTPGANEDAAAMTAAMQKNMMYIFPVMTVFIALQLPAALALYWLVSTVFGIGQQLFLLRVLKLSPNTPVV